MEMETKHTLEPKQKAILDNLPDEDLLLDMAELFKVFGDSSRIRIVSVLCVTPSCVKDIADVLNMSISAVSHQLRILRTNKLVKSRKNGKEVIYSLDDDHVRTLFDIAREHLLE